MRILALTLLLALSAPAFALDAFLSWTAPTQTIDGALVTKPVTYNVYNDKGRLATGITLLTFTAANFDPTQPCWTVTAVIETIESVRSNRACKNGGQPFPPGALTVK